jgi:hypothetical protein
MEDFLKAIGGGEVTTGDIKLPDGGIKKATAAKKDPVVAQVQQLIIDKLGPFLADDPIFIKFKGYGADGNYGPTTESMIEIAKLACELKDEDGTVITSELVNKLQTGNKKIVESYLGLRGQLVERLFEQFNVDAAKARSKAISSGKAPTGNQGTKEAPASNNHDWSKLGCLTKQAGATLRTNSDGTWTMYTLKTEWTNLMFWNDRTFTTVAAYDDAEEKNVDAPMLTSVTKLDASFRITDNSGDTLKWTCDNIAKIIAAKDFAEVAAACGSASTKPAVTKKYNDSEMKSDVDTLVDDLDGIVTVSNLQSILTIIQKYENGESVDDTDLDHPITVNSVKRLMALYSEDESGDTLAGDVESVGTGSLAGGEKIKKQILNKLSKYSTEDEPA